MENSILVFFIFLFVVLVSVLCFVFISMKSKLLNKENEMRTLDDGTEKSDINSEINESSFKISIPIEQLPANLDIKKTDLFEITDSNIIARISETVPELANVASKTISNKALKNIELYKAVIPSGTTLSKSKELEGAVRGFYRSDKGIAGQANLVKVDSTKLNKASQIANGVSNVMNITSLVVGQYYMSEVNSKLEDMNQNINKIGDFQQREFKSRILSLISRVGETSKFSSEILENGELRNRKLQSLDNMQGEVTQLLQQVNMTIDEITQDKKINFAEYQVKVEEFDKLIRYQQILISVLEEISKLIYLLNKGAVSAEYSYSIFNIYLEQSQTIQQNLVKWHNEWGMVLGLDIEKNRKNKDGLEGFVSKIPGIFNDDLNYKGLQEGLKEKILSQTDVDALKHDKEEEILNDDVQIVVLDGKYYYLLSKEH